MCQGPKTTQPTPYPVCRFKTFAFSFSLHGSIRNRHPNHLLSQNWPIQFNFWFNLAYSHDPFLHEKGLGTFIINSCLTLCQVLIRIFLCLPVHWHSSLLISLIAIMSHPLLTRMFQPLIIVINWLVYPTPPKSFLLLRLCRVMGRSVFAWTVGYILLSPFLPR